MANTYKSINLDAAGGSSGTEIYSSTFNSGSWTLNSGSYELDILEASHELGALVIVSVEELVGGYYQEVETVIQNTNGNIKIIIGDDSRFTGRVLIKG